MTLVASVLQNIRAEHYESLDKNERRPSMYGAYELFKEQTEAPGSILSAQVREQIGRSFNRTIQIPVLNHKDVTLLTSRSCTVSPDPNTSALVALTFNTYGFGFTMNRAQYMTNEIQYELDMRHNIISAMNKVAATLDADAVAALETNKNQLWTGTTAYYANAGNALQVPNADKFDYFNNVDAVMTELDFMGDFTVLGSISMMPLVRRLSAQGPGNDENDAFQFSPFDFKYSKRVTNGAGVTATNYVVAPGSVAMDTRVDWDAQMGSRVGGGSKQWSVENVPVPGTPHEIEMGLYYNEDCSDQSDIQSPDTAVAGNTRTLLESYEFTFDVTFLTVYNSDLAARANPIVKAEILDAP